MEKDFLVMSKVIREEYSRLCKQRREDIKANWGRRGWGDMETKMDS